MATPTIQDFTDAKRDLDDLEKIVNLPNTVPTRVGGDKLSVDQALSQIVVGEVTVYSAATTYTAIEDWIEYSGVVYRPLPSALPIGPEAFDGNKWAVVQGAGDVSYISEPIAIVDGQVDYVISSVDLDANNARFELAKGGGVSDGTLLIKDVDYTVLSSSQITLSRAYPEGYLVVSNFAPSTSNIKNLMPTTESLISSSSFSGLFSGSIVEVMGYSTKGDGGAAQWRKTGVTGLTASQTPADLADAKLTDANGHEWELVFDGVLLADKLGVVGDGSDSYLPILAAINASNGGEVILPEGDVATSAEIPLNNVGQRLRGAGAGSYQDGINNYKTRLYSTSTTDAVVRISLESCILSDMLIDADATRSAAPRNTTAANFNCGVRVEGDDVAPPEGDVFDTQLKNLHIVNQPNDGLVIVGRAFGSRLEKVISEDNNGHGLAITNGEYTGRTNTAICGVLTWTDCNFDGNEGHGVRAGGNSDTDYTIRLVAINSEGLNNCGTPALLEDAADSFFNCDNLTVLNGAATGTARSGASPATNAGYSLMGLGGTLYDPRILDTTEPVRILKHPGRNTKGWRIVNPHIRSGVVSSYLAYVDAGVENVQVWMGDDTGGLTDATNIVGVNGLDVYSNNLRVSNIDEQHLGRLLTSYGMNLLAEKKDNQAITTTPLTIFDASEVGKKWSINGRHTGDPCLSSFSCEVVGGSTPVVSNVVNQSGAAVTYAVTVSGTDIQLATSAGSRSSDIVIKETVVS